MSGLPDVLKWGAVIVLMASALGAFYWFSEESLLLRVIGLLAVSGVALGIVYQTEKGRLAWGFIREARNEVRKVVWPTRRETGQTTLIVIAVVGLVAVLLWLFDSMLTYLVRLLLGTGGT